MIDKKDLRKTLNLFRTCGPLFLALGDRVRQHLVLDIANAGKDGMNVTDLTANNNLSRPAISHHLKVLKDCGLVQSYKAGTQVYYCISLRKNFEDMKALLDSIEQIVDKIGGTDTVLAT